MFSIYYLNKRFKNALQHLLQPQPYQEVLEANFNKLPDTIKVQWFRDGKYIIGNIEADGHQYKTQALSADEFIEMVNDTIYTVYDIPGNCINTLRQAKSYAPPAPALQKLRDHNIAHADMAMLKAKALAPA